jgi:hypothetical protein
MRLSILAVITCLCVAPAHAKYSGGTGEPNDPYQIATAADLIALGETPADYDKHFILTADIDLDPNLPGRKVFDRAVIAPDVNDANWSFDGTPFMGIFNGNGHTILHLAIKGGGYLGLFGEMRSGGEVKDLGVVNVNVTGSGACVGGLVGCNGVSSTFPGGDVIRCYSTGMVSGSSNVGGLVGMTRGGNVTQCNSNSAVSGVSSVGGLLGGNYGPSIVTACYSVGVVEGIDCVGGLVGENGGEIIYCYSAASVNRLYLWNDDTVGGLVGSSASRDSDDGPVVGLATMSFWDTQTSGQATSAGGTGKTTAEMQTAKTFLDAGWDFVGETANGTEDIWKIVEGQTYPLLSWQKYSGGTGEPNDPYLIFTAEQLNAIGAEPNDWSKHSRLMADIDLSAFDGRDGRPVFNVIAPGRMSRSDFGAYIDGVPFTGVFDGNGHAILNFTFAATDAANAYLGLFGYVNDPNALIMDLGLIDPNLMKGSVPYEIGGGVGCLVGCLERGTISGCYVQGGSVKGDYGAGGLAGENCGSIARSWTACMVRGNRGIGGLVGYNSGTVTHCYSTGTIRATAEVGGLVGYNAGYVLESFWDIQTSGHKTSAGGIGLTTAQMQSRSTFTCWAVDGVWTIDGGKDYPRLSWQKARGEPLTKDYSYGGGSGTHLDPYLILTAEHFYMIGLIEYDWDKHFKLIRDLNLAGLGAYPIGRYDHPYGGVFDGNGHTISHLTILGVDYVGLFGWLSSPAEVKDLGVIDVNITASRYYVGGIVGQSTGVVAHCYSTGRVSGDNYVGGLVGSNLGDIHTSSSECDVHGVWGVGGLVGVNHGYSSIVNCYSTGSVSSASEVGGLAGINVSEVTASFWDIQTSGQATSAGGTGKTTAEMQTAQTFLDAGWDFVGETANGTEDIWWIDEGKDYPRLWWELTAKK